MLKPEITTIAAWRERGLDDVILGIGKPTEAVTDLQLFAKQHHHAEMLEALFRRLRITQINETDYDVELTSIEELCKLRIDDLEEQFADNRPQWEQLNEISELMKFLILRWLDRIHDMCVIKTRIWSLVVTVLRVSVDQRWLEHHTIHLLAAWSKVSELLPTLKDVYNHETLARLETAVSEIPEKVTGLAMSEFVGPYDTNVIWDEKDEH